MEKIKVGKIRRQEGFLPALIDVDDDPNLARSILFLGNARGIGPTQSGSEGSCHEES